MVEVHRRSYHPFYARAYATQVLMLQLHELGYRVAFLESNVAYPTLGAEWTLVRKTHFPMTRSPGKNKSRSGRT